MLKNRLDPGGCGAARSKSVRRCYRGCSLLLTGIHHGEFACAHTFFEAASKRRDSVLAIYVNEVAQGSEQGRVCHHLRCDAGFFAFVPSREDETESLHALVAVRIELDR